MNNMKNRVHLSLLAGFMFCSWFMACKSDSFDNKSSATTEEQQSPGGQSGVKDDESQKTVVGIAIGSKDHTTLVAAVKAAELVDVLSNAGPFTVFAPTNAAFDQLPKGTVDDLLKPENKDKLQSILQHHVMTSALEASFFQDGQTMGMVDGTNVTFHIKNGVTYIDNAKIIASVRASNGWVHVIDAVVLPPTK